APSVEALGEFRVETSSMPAEYGRTTGGIEIFSTKAGNNQFHGDAYDIFRNEKLDANTFHNNFLGFPRALDRQNDYGGPLGGRCGSRRSTTARTRLFSFSPTNSTGKIRVDLRRRQFRQPRRRPAISVPHWIPRGSWARTRARTTRRFTSERS